MAKIHLNSSGLKFESDKDNIFLRWNQSPAGFIKSEAKNIPLKQIVSEWIAVYKNHLEFYFNGTPENSPGFKFGKVGITDLTTEHHPGEHEITYIVVGGKLIRQNISREPRLFINSGGYRNYVYLYLEGPDKPVKKLFYAIRTAIKKDLAMENSG